MRGAYALLFLVTMRIATQLVTIVAIFQFLHTLFAARPNAKVQQFGKTLGIYLNQTAEFVSYDLNTKPWPFAGRPSVNSSSETVE